MYPIIKPVKTLVKRNLLRFCGYILRLCDKKIAYWRLTNRLKNFYHPLATRLSFGLFYGEDPWLCAPSLRMVYPVRNHFLT